VCVPALQVTSPAQAPALVAQLTVQVEPLQVTAFAHEFLPEQVMVLLLADVVMPPEQDDPPLQVMPHWSPEQVMLPLQALSEPQVIVEVAATLEIVPLQDPLPEQLSVHWLPAQLMGPAQAFCLQVMSQLVAFEQSTPPGQPPLPQVTWHPCSPGQATAVVQLPWAVQSNTQLPLLYWPPLPSQTVPGVTSGPASMAAPFVSGPT
jgi:hypothetical protein